MELTEMEKSPNKPYKWIAAEIEKLDPYKDYEKIYRLSVAYSGTADFMNHLIYTLTFPNFIVTQHGAQAVWRVDGGKVLHKAVARQEDTEMMNSTWWYYGPSDPRCQASVAKLNKIHAALALQTPGAFSHEDDFIYTLGFSALLMHRFRLRLGISGISRKEQIANYLFMRELSKLFVIEGGKKLTWFPEDFESMVKFVEDYEAQDFPGSEQGNLVCLAIFNAFSFRFFPPALRWLGDALPVALSMPSTLKAHKIAPVNPILGWLIRKFFALIFLLQQYVLPDNKEANFPIWDGAPPEVKKMRREEHRRMDKEYTPYFAEKQGNDKQWSGCPYHVDLQRKAKK